MVRCVTSVLNWAPNSSTACSMATLARVAIEQAVDEFGAQLSTEVTHRTTKATCCVVTENTVSEGDFAKARIQDECSTVTAGNTIFENHVFVNFNPEEGQATTLVVTGNDGGGVAISINRTTVDHTVGGRQRCDPPWFG